ncbi:BTAD domain-containing putative transcriptional regulator [Nonomuraea polychroma]|uniref:BTAD domain-containing putative transcriptional regulator n=1 Tax=Nonomuraea polychroma TaxID=46176 RepID=UPI003D91E83C
MGIIVTFQVLGPLAAHFGDEQVQLGRPRQRSVLARLLAAGGQVVSVDRLIEDLYSGEAPPRALAAVQAYVSNLRRALEPDRPPRAPASVLVTAPPGYAIKVDPDEVDAWRFARMVRDPAATPEILAAALALWRGPAYAEFAGAHWADAEASRLEELRLSAVERHADAVIRLGGAAAAVPDLERLLDEHPLREGAWALLARALYRCERQGEALAALRRARARLVEELGVDPGPELRRLEADILAQAPHLTEAAPPATPTERVAIDAQPYVGRRAELAAVAATSGGVVLVSGEPGAGKTAFLEQVRAARGWPSGWGRCPEDEGAPAAWAWAELLRDLARRAPPVDPRPLAPLLQDAPAMGDVPAARFRLHRAVATYLGTCAPLLIVLDDLHRADAETLALLTHVAAETRGLPVLVVCSYRHTEPTDQLEETLAALARHEPVRIHLTGLDHAEVGQLVRRICSADDATVAEIAQRTGGNPFFVREMARLLDAEGALEVPAGVRDVLRRRVARLPGHAQTVLRASAVLGRECDLDTLVAVCGGEEDAVLEGVEAGLVTGLLIERDNARVAFAHVLVRDTLYGELSRNRRRRLHARAARAISERRQDNVAALAHHFTAAGMAPEAMRYSRLAAEQAERRFAHHEAAALWRQALDHFEGDPRERLKLTLSLVAALANTGQLVRARAYREQAVRAALPYGDPHLLAQVVASFEVPTFWSSRQYATVDHELVEAVEDALRRLPPGDSVTRCRLLTALAFELEGETTERGYEASLEAEAMARRLEDPALVSLALNGRFHQTFRHGELAEREKIGRELLALSGGQVTVEALGHLVLMLAATGRADFAAADTHADAAMALAEKYGLRISEIAVNFYRGLRLGLAGNEQEAEAHLRAGAELAGRLGMWEHEVGILALARYGLRLMRGDLTELLPELEPLAAYEPWREQTVELYALALCHAGRLGEALALAPTDPPPLRSDYFWHVLAAVRGLLGLAINDSRRIAWAYEALLPYSAQPVGGTGYLAVCPTAQILGDLAVHLGRSAEAHYREALEIAERAGVIAWAEAARRRLLPVSGSDRA